MGDTSRIGGNSASNVTANQTNNVRADQRQSNTLGGQRVEAASAQPRFASGRIERYLNLSVKAKHEIEEGEDKGKIFSNLDEKSKRTYLPTIDELADKVAQTWLTRKSQQLKSSSQQIDCSNFREIRSKDIKDQIAKIHFNCSHMDEYLILFDDFVLKNFFGTLKTDIASLCYYETACRTLNYFLDRLLDDKLDPNDDHPFFKFMSEPVEAVKTMTSILEKVEKDVVIQLLQFEREAKKRKAGNFHGAVVKCLADCLISNDPKKAAESFKAEMLEAYGFDSSFKKDEQLPQTFVDSLQKRVDKGTLKQSTKEAIMELFREIRHWGNELSEGPELEEHLRAAGSILATMVEG